MEQGDVAACIRAVEALILARIDEATVGTVVSQVPRGPGSAEFMSIDNGYDDINAVFRLRADQSSVAFTFIPSPGNQVATPIFVIENYLASWTPAVRVAGADLVTNSGPASDAFVSINTDQNELWLTLNATVTDAIDIQVGAFPA
jgi:hypothetical protein